MTIEIDNINTLRCIVVFVVSLRRHEVKVDPFYAGIIHESVCHRFVTIINQNSMHEIDKLVNHVFY